MSERKQPQTFRELVAVLAQLVRDDEPQTEEELDERIRDMGYEPDRLVLDMRARINQAIAQSPLNWRNKNAQLEKIKGDLRVSPPSQLSRSEKEARLRKILENNKQEAAVAFRKFHELSDSDLDTLLAQAEFLEKKRLHEPDEE